MGIAFSYQGSETSRSLSSEVDPRFVKGKLHALLSRNPPRDPTAAKAFINHVLEYGRGKGCASCNLSQTQNEDDVGTSIYMAVQDAFDELMFFNSLNEFALGEIAVSFNPTLCDRFFKAIDNQEDKRQAVRIVFHGTRSQCTGLILQNGFDDARVGGFTDPGWYGKGHYFTPNIEYAIAYTQNKRNQIRRLNFANALDVNVTVDSVIVAFIISGNKREINRIDAAGLEGMPIDEEFDSHEVFVDKDGEICEKERAHATELVIPSGERTLPFMSLSLTRVDTCVIWYDEHPEYKHNMDLLLKLQRQSAGKLRILQLKKPEELRLAQKPKTGVAYRFVVAGQSGKDVVSKLRADRRAQIKEAPILVFCSDVLNHRKWASDFKAVVLTDREEEFLSFCMTGVLPRMPFASRCTVM